MAGYSINTSPAPGIPVIVYAVNMVSTGGDAIDLFNGDDSANSWANPIIKHHFSTNSETLDFPFGLIFPDGCYISSIGDALTVVYEKL